MMQKQNFSVQYIQQLADWAEELLPDGIRNDIKKSTPHARSPKGKKPVVEYNDIDRESLDKMIENIVEIEEL